MNEPSNFDNDYNVCPNRPCYYLKCPNSKYDQIDARISESFQFEFLCFEIILFMKTLLNFSQIFIKFMKKKLI